jgi:hypothetical protein
LQLHKPSLNPYIEGTVRLQCYFTVLFIISTMNWVIQ